MKTSKTAKITMGSLVVLYIAYAIAILVHNVKTYDSILAGVLSSISVLFICAILSFILLASAFGGWGKILRKAGRHGEAATYEAQAEAGQKKYKGVKTKYERKDDDPLRKSRAREEAKRRRRAKREVDRDIAYLEYETEREMRGGVGVKKVITGVALLLMCSAVAGVMFWLYAMQSAKFEDGRFIETTATVVQVKVGEDENGTPRYQLSYVYYDQNGNGYVYDDTGSWSGVNFGAGSTATVYYNVDNPEITATKSVPAVMLAVACIFLGVGIIAFFANIFQSTSNVVIPIIFGSIFAFFAAAMFIGVSQAGGMPFLDVMLSGPLIYASSALGLLGCVFVIYGLFNLFREIFFLARYISKKRGRSGS